MVSTAVVAVDVAGLHQDADAALDQLGVLHVHVDHQVFVHIAQAGHGAGGDHVEDHLLGAGGLHAGGTGDDFGADFGNDGDVGGFGDGRAVIAGNGGGEGATGAGVGDGGDHVRGAAGSGDADHDVFAGGAAAGNVALAEFLGVFIDFNGGGQGLGAAGHDVLDLSGGGGVGGGTLGGVEGGDAAAGPGSDINETPAVSKAAGDLVDDLGNFG